MRQPHFSTVILKLTSFCNLNCSYCYMFNLADATCTRVPRYLPAETAGTAVARLADHVRSHGGRRMKVVLHGGEPSLWPMVSFGRLFGVIGEVRGAGLAVDVSFQTNGVLLGRALIEALLAHDVTLGVSLDGPEAENDRARVTSQMRSPTWVIAEQTLALPNPHTTGHSAGSAAKGSCRRRGAAAGRDGAPGGAGPTRHEPY